MPKMDGQQVANTIWSMGKIGVSWETLSQHVRVEISRAIARTACTEMTPQGISNTIHGLSNCRARWSMLPNKLTSALTRGLDRTLTTMKEQVRA